ncbi:hypothetical protein CAEBREN_05086 [Caenorhabditis brenneri]|uniref:Uncharacterized protein n=1 Tax=Caenorhabditis brenneri TaxID=135651 RepID=G0M8X0_CAEBE|nr:hypothetical protein CAEBREN_05086 [Caenorhabditis brenneri]
MAMSNKLYICLAALNLCSTGLIIVAIFICYILVIYELERRKKELSKAECQEHKAYIDEISRHGMLIFPFFAILPGCWFVQFFVLEETDVSFFVAICFLIFVSAPIPAMLSFLWRNPTYKAVLLRIFCVGRNNSVQPAVVPVGAFLKDLKNAKEDENSGLLTPFPVTSTTSLIANLTNQQLESLKGFIYVTNSEQANDKNFRVYDVDRFSIIETEQPGNYTLVFLSTNYETNPAHSSTISHCQQQNDSVVNIYRGIPGDRRRIYRWQLFSNPIVWDPVRGDSKIFFFPNVEKFSLSFPIFYIEVTNEIFFHIRPTYYNLNGHKTAAYNTAGFYMKTKTEQPRDVTVTFSENNKHNGITGAILYGLMPTDEGKIILRGDSFNTTSARKETIFRFIDHSITENLSFSSVESFGGEFFIQYFILQKIP